MNEEDKKTDEINRDWEKTNPLTPAQNRYMLAAIVIIAILIIGYLISGIIEMLNNQSGG